MVALTQYNVTPNGEYDFSILIPTWNNLAFAQNCIRSIQHHSTLQIQIILIVNEGIDSTLEWVKEAGIDFLHTAHNAGICYALNAARALVKSSYIVYANDDMYFLPNWDVKLMIEIKNLGHHHFMLSATMIEPDDTGNPCVSIGNYGKTLDTFDEQSLLKNYKNHFKSDWKGSTWPPNVMHKDIWDLVGGMSIEYSPGMYSDPDLSMKLYQAGIRHFKGIGESLVYHFGSKSTKRIRKNKGRRTFLLKWGISANDFSKYYLQTGQTWDTTILTYKPSFWQKIVSKLKRITAILSE